MLIHSVYFWLKPELTDAQRADFRRGLESLAGVKALVSLYVGTPAAIPLRPVVEASYSFSITGVFKDLAGHDAYQVDPLHKAFLEQFRTFWTKVQIYDAA
jgi:hypothetical protein